MELKTPLYDVHLQENGKIVPFGGYLLPVQYPTGVIKEHLAVRENCGLFDVSHMGVITFKGKSALKSLNYILTNDFTNMKTGKVRYTVMCNENGGCIDDLIVYKFAEDYYFLVVNASNRHKDYQHMKKEALEGTVVQDISDSIAIVALQGPKSSSVIKKLLPAEQIPTGNYNAIEEVYISDMKCMISTTGYTGEEGYEIYTASENAIRLWQILREAGTEYNLIPCGLGARDTLRLEASMPLYGHEINEEITPLEAGLGFAVKMNKEDFIGKKALLEKGEPEVKRVGLKMLDRGIMRENQDIYLNGKLIGHTTSGTHLPYLKESLAMALIDKQHSELHNIVEVDVRGRKLKAEIIELPFYSRNK
ncbi:MAG: glycine cleavage system aminomethyltransferase GcvT [Erysipelotrichaceae bacterium]|jgi:aminomethyltransferase